MAEVRNVLSGQVTADTIPPIPTRTVRVYICSTGVDTIQERNALVERVYPGVREYCREKYGLEFQAVDLQWGQPVEHYPNDHSWATFCHREIQRCQELSTGPNFLLLVGQKYGSLPLPTTIPYDEYYQLKEALYRHRGRETRNAPLLDEWYELDENSLPNVFLLRLISSNIPEYIDGDEVVQQQGREKWKEVEKEVGRLLRKAAEWCYRDGVLDHDVRNKYFMSEFESQVQKGVEESVEPTGRCLLVTRTVLDLKNYVHEPRAANYAELVYNERNERLEMDVDPQNRLNGLKSRVERSLPAEDMLKFNVLWRYEDGINPKLHKEYLNKLCSKVSDRLLRLVDQVANIEEAQDNEIYSEVLQHWVRCQEKAADHYGREDILSRIGNYLLGSCNKPLVLYGESGAGKTTIMSKCALQVRNVIPKQVVTVVRYVGYTPQSANLRELLQSLCSQLVFLQVCDKTAVIPDDCTELIKYFHELLNSFPEDRYLLIFLDAVCQMRAEYNAHALLWIPSRLKYNVRFVISLKASGHDLLKKLENDIVQDKECFLEIPSLRVEEASSMLTHFIESGSKYLTDSQMATLCHLLKNCTSPMYVRFLAEVACRKWMSTTDVATYKLPNSVHEGINFLFDEMEYTFGRVLFARSMCYLLASDSGLSDCEMEDILSLDDVVLNDVFGETHPSVRRIQPCKWLEVKDGMSPFVSTKENDGVTVNFLSHETFVEVIHERYLSDKEAVKEIHSLLADYFLGLWANKNKPIKLDIPDDGLLLFPFGTEADRLVPTQPLTFVSQNGETRYNKRTYDQVPKHLFLSERLEELNKLVLFNYDWLYNKTKSLSLQQIMLDLALNPGVESTLVEDALRVSQSVIEKNINNMGPEITGHLLPYFQSHPNIRNLIRQCDSNGLKHCAVVPNFPYYVIPGSSLQYVLETGNKIDHCCLSSDGQTLTTKGRDLPQIYNCDATTGELKETLYTSTGDLHITPDGRYIVVADHVMEKAVKIHRGEDGKFLGQLIVMNHLELKPKEKYRMSSVCVSNDRICVIVTTDKSYLCIADIPSCKFLQIVELDSRTNVCSISPNGSFVVCNAGEYLLSYSLYTLEHLCTTSLPHRPNAIAFSHDSCRCYVSNKFENKILVMHIHDGNVDLVYKAVVEEWMPGDKIVDLKMSRDNQFLAIRGLSNLLVYDRVKEKVVGHFPRPSDVPEEFKLPKGQYVDLFFTNVDFSCDSKYFFGAIFRNIYVWEIESGYLVTTIQARVGVIKRLLVSCERDQLFTLVDGCSEVQAWSLDDAIKNVDLLDRLSDSISNITITSDQSKAFVSCKSSDEIAVVDMRFGTMLDMLTHESTVHDFAVSPTGNHLLVSTEPKRRNCAVKLWDLTNRQILTEFGNAVGYCVSLRKMDSLILASQADLDFKAPYLITKFDFSDVGPNASVMNYQIPFLLSRPFATPDDRHLVMLTALDYVETKGIYNTPMITVIDLENTENVRQFTPESFQGMTSIVAILDVRQCPQEASVVAVIYLSQVHGQTCDHGYTNGDVFPQYGLFILDVDQGIVKKMSEPFLQPQASIDSSLLMANNFSFCIDAASNVFDIPSGSYTHKVPHGNSTNPWLIVLKNKAVVYANGSALKVVRLRDSKELALCETHSQISTMAVCQDDRTLMIGCKDGTLVSYVIIDPDEGDVVDTLGTIESRQTTAASQGSNNGDSSGRSSRAWDKVSADPKVPGYSRPPSALSSGPSEKEQLRKIKPVSRIRPKSDSLLYTNSRSATCVMM